jgi:hypothetical protein
VRRKLFWWIRDKGIRRDEIKTVKQTLDTKPGRDSSESWGLSVYSKNDSLAVLWRQDRENCEWFGEILAAWAGVEFDKPEKGMAQP